jgi:YesN/AraC family two-component response regulator
MVKRIIVEDEIIRVTQTKYVAGFYMAPHTHDHAAVSWILSGRFEESVDGQMNYVSRSKTLIKPADFLHSDQYQEECIIICAYFKDEQQLNHTSRKLLQDWAGLYGVNWAAFQPYFGATDQSSKKAALNQFLSLLSNSKSNDESAPDWMYKLKDYIDEHFYQSIPTSHLADLFEVHPVYLARVFRKYTGMSIKSYVTHLRIRNAMAGIISANESLTQIAMVNGFADQSHFIRNFKEASGLTPKGFRQIIR